MRRAKQAATIGFGAMMMFQAALAVGAPLGDAAWGGAHAQLTTGERIGSAISVFIYLAAILVVRGRAAGREERRYRWGIWVLATLFGIAGVMNLASESPWENVLLAPVALGLSALCFVVARGAASARSRAADGQPTLLSRCIDRRATPTASASAHASTQATLPAARETPSAASRAKEHARFGGPECRS